MERRGWIALGWLLACIGCSGSPVVDSRPGNWDGGPGRNDLGQGDGRSDGAPGDGSPGDGSPGDGSGGDGSGGDGRVDAVACADGGVTCGTANCVDLQTDAMNCGACGTRCPAPEHGRATCSAGACGIACDATYGLEDRACVPLVPRLIAPLSTAIVTAHRPRLRWELPAGLDGAQVELCRDRACTMVITTIDATGPQGAPAVDLLPGLWYWRARGRSGTTVGTRLTPTWQFTAGVRSATQNASWDTLADVNGDGYGDVLVGVPGNNTVQVFHGSATGLPPTPTQTLIGPDGSDNFGQSVASAGDVNGDGFADVVVGANGSQQAFVYLAGATGLAAMPARTLTGPENSDFGRSVNSADDVNGDGYADLAIGAPMGNLVRVYHGSATGIGASPAVTLAAPTDTRSFGYNLDGAGDVDANGYGDLIVGTRSGDVALVYHGSATGLPATPTTTLHGPAMSEFGKAVACAGDVNGDGYAEVIVSCFNTGVVFVFQGGATGLSTTAAAMMSGPPGYTDYGDAVATAGDANVDGYADVMVSAPIINRVFVYHGGATGVVTMVATTLDGPPDGAFGMALACAGDIERDGPMEVLVGAPENNSVSVYGAGMTGLATTPVIVLHGSGHTAFGQSVACRMVAATPGA